MLYVINTHRLECIQLGLKLNGGQNGIGVDKSIENSLPRLNLNINSAIKFAPLISKHCERSCINVQIQ